MLTKYQETFWNILHTFHILKGFVEYHKNHWSNENLYILSTIIPHLENKHKTTINMITFSEKPRWIAQRVYP